MRGFRILSLLMTATCPISNPFLFPKALPNRVRVVAEKEFLATQSPNRLKMFGRGVLYSKSTFTLASKYNEDDEDDDDDDDDEDEFDDAAVEKFRSKMSSLFGDDTQTASPLLDESSTIDDLIRFATQRQQPATSSPPISTTTTVSEESDTDWARPLVDLDEICPGTVLVANPAYFIKNFKMPEPTPYKNDGVGKKDENIKGKNVFANLFQNQIPKIDLGLLRKFGLTVPPPTDLGPDRQADLLPVLLLVEQTTQPVSGILKAAAIGSGRRWKAILLNRRTGYLLGDLDQSQTQESSDDLSKTTESTDSKSLLVPLLQKFCIQPVWFGGVDSVVSDSNFATGLDMLHFCNNISGTKLTDDGLYWGGDPQLAQNVVSEGVIEDEISGTTRRITGFDFKFFVQCTSLSESDFQKFVNSNDEHSSKASYENNINENVLSSTCLFYAVQVSKDVLFKSRDRMGTRRAKPLWTEIMELLGGPYTKIKDRLYSSNFEDDDDDSETGTGDGSFVWI